MIPRFGTPPERRAYPRRPGIYAILPRGGRILTTMQIAPEPEVQLPGGGIEPGEHPLRALMREVREETGWGIARPRKCGVYRRFTFMPDYGVHAEKICHVYVAAPVRRLDPPTEPDHAALWLDPVSALENLASAGDREMLRRFLRQR